MGDVLRSALRSSWSRNAAYAGRLVGDLAPAQFVAQPVAGRVMNHPAWILCHLNLYSEIVGSLVRAEGFEDPLGRPYGRGSKVSLDLVDYPPIREIIERFTFLHAQAGGALDAAHESIFTSPTPLARLRAVSPTVGELLVMLMIKHESFHLGQLSAWRRAMGMAPVEM